MRTLEQHPKMLGKKIFKSRRSQMFSKEVILKNSQENTCNGGSFDKIAGLKTIAIKKLERMQRDGVRGVRKRRTHLLNFE